MLLDTARRQLFGKEQRTPPAPIPIVSLTRADFQEPSASGLRVTWLGHSTVLLEIDGVNVLVDPVWCERPSPWQWVGPRRFHPPPLPLAELPALDVVILTHDHYDHLDMAAVRALATDPRQQGMQFVTALGVGAHLELWGIAAGRIVELDWHEALDVGALHITAIPARHFSGRTFKRNQTLWAAWAIAGPGHRVFHGGDSGYFDGIGLVGAQHGPFDLTMLEIGAYGDAWPDIHSNPEGAVRAHTAIGSGLLLPIHWGTFNLAFHAWDDPPERLMVAAKQAPTTKIVVPRPGQSLQPAAPPPLDPWWRRVVADRGRVRSCCGAQTGSSLTRYS
jgi:L-ascorbate metabolism protein UlaG (beta-lactamase superfamily)